MEHLIVLVASVIGIYAFHVLSGVADDNYKGPEGANRNTSASLLALVGSFLIFMGVVYILGVISTLFR